MSKKDTNKLKNDDNLEKNNIIDQYNLENINILESNYNSELEKYNCRHNDIKPEEILVDKGKIKIIDFGWAYEKNKDNPKSWPECLGNDFKSDKNVFNDKESFNKSISYIKAL